MVCKDLSETKKYNKANRPNLPPYKAKDCLGMVKTGNNGRLYLSQKKNKRHIWIPVIVKNRSRKVRSRRRLSSSDMKLIRSPSVKKLFKGSKGVKSLCNRILSTQVIKNNFENKTCSKLVKKDIPTFISLVEKVYNIENEKVVSNNKQGDKQAYLGKTYTSVKAGNKFCEYLANNQSNLKDIAHKRARVRTDAKKWLKGSSAIEPLLNTDSKRCNAFLSMLLKSYDKHFFESKLTRILKSRNCHFKIVFVEGNNSMRGGETEYEELFKYHPSQKKDIKHKNCDIKIRKQIFKHGVKLLRKGYTLKNDGLKCKTILDCVLITFEHEFTHALIFCMCLGIAGKKGQKYGLWKGKTNPATWHSRLFMSILNNSFGHISYRHDMILS